MILKYPDPTLLQISGYVRHFDDELKELVNTLIATAKEHNLKALAAIQIGIPKRVVVLEKGGNFIPLINPTIFAHSGKLFLSKERDESLPNVEVEVKRFPIVKVMYQDLEGKEEFLKAQGEEAVLLQRKIDMVFGGMLFDKLSQKERKKFFKEYGFIDTCPTYFVKDRILAFLRIGLTLHALALLLSFFISFSLPSLTLFLLESFILLFYAFYARYETKKYKNCTSCQNANIIGTVGIYFAVILGLFLLGEVSPIFEKV
ncbi:MAG: peptide deformylase [Epsilonproteobacteria bacterium]|nr:peptide deformylase [Campylobacterota bacterium]